MGRDSQGSSKRERREFSREFKLEAVRLATSGDRSLADVARDLGIHPNLLRSWKRQALASSSLAHGVFPGNGKLTSQDEEIRRLRRELAIAREERDFLKKATAFFAKGSR